MIDTVIILNTVIIVIGIIGREREERILRERGGEYMKERRQK